MTEEFGVEYPNFDRLLRIPRRQVLGKREVQPQARHQQEQEAEIVEVDRREVRVKAVDLPHDHHRRDDGRNARKDGTDNEVRSKNR
jgi:hypothetical protein